MSRGQVNPGTASSLRLHFPGSPTPSGTARAGWKPAVPGIGIAKLRLTLGEFVGTFPLTHYFLFFICSRVNLERNEALIGGCRLHFATIHNATLRPNGKASFFQ